MARQISIENLERLALLAAREGAIMIPNNVTRLDFTLAQNSREPLSTAGIEAIEYDWTDTQVEIPPALVLFVLCQHGVLSC
jgi:hypothetical protein